MELIQGTWCTENGRKIDIADDEAYFLDTELSYDLETIDGNIILETPDGKWSLTADSSKKDQIFANACIATCKDMIWIRDVQVSHSS